MKKFKIIFMEKILNLRKNNTTFCLDMDISHLNKRHLKNLLLIRPVFMKTCSFFKKSLYLQTYKADRTT